MTRSKATGNKSRAGDPAPEPALAAPLARRLLAWFQHQRRDLPWRRDRDPYRIWVSEVMLQQTQVATVASYFERFVKAFPDVHELARADEQAVLRLWEGLGYYRRARHLHQAARILVSNHDGQLPDDPTVWQALPGVGRYMVGAILSQAFDRRLPIVEANSQRVLCRLFGQRFDPRAGAGRKWVWQAAAAILPRRQVGDFNQALMELGALICTPSKPACLLCPVAKACRARQQGLQESIPLKPRKREPIAVEEAAVVIQRGERVLLVQRPNHGRWAAMWEFPHRERNGAGLAELVGELTGLQATVGEPIMKIRHGVTHHRITLHCFAARYRGGRFRSDFYCQGRWLQPAKLHDYPVSTPQRQLIEAVITRHQGRSATGRPVLNQSD